MMASLEPQSGLPVAEEASPARRSSDWRMVVTAGTGFFTDAYDLFVIGVVTAILAPLWHLSITQIAVLNAAALAAAAAGAILFGILSDKFGRKKLYGIEVVILFIGAILSAVSPSFTWLLISRVIVGLGIGGDYPSSAVVVSEHAGSKNRGYLVLLVFAMQALGLIVGPLLASILLSTAIPPETVWRILLGLGAIPAASVFYLRRKIQETPHYLLSKQSSPYVVSRIVSDLTGLIEEEPEKPAYKKQSIFSKKWLKLVIGTAGSWFLLDVAFYGNGVSSTLIIQKIQPVATLLSHTIIAALLFLIFAVPGYFLAAKYVDKIGRKLLQGLGFVMMALCYAAIAYIPGLVDILPLFLLIFGVSFFFVNFGPNTTTFLIPSEVYPTSIRAKGHGFSAAIGKLGAFIGVLFLPILLKAMGLQMTMALMAAVSLAGIITTMILPEMKQACLSTTEEQ